MVVIDMRCSGRIDVDIDVGSCELEDRGAAGLTRNIGLPHAEELGFYHPNRPR
jgi:hypothetical protein